MVYFHYLFFVQSSNFDKIMNTNSLPPVTNTSPTKQQPSIAVPALEIPNLYSVPPPPYEVGAFTFSPLIDTPLPSYESSRPWTKPYYLKTRFFQLFLTLTQINLANLDIFGPTCSTFVLLFLIFSPTLTLYKVIFYDCELLKFHINEGDHLPNPYTFSDSYNFLDQYLIFRPMFNFT